MSTPESEIALVPRWTGLFVHSLRRLLHGSTRLRLGHARRDRGGLLNTGARRVEEFSARFVRQVGHRYSLVERPGGDCIFWDKKAGCTVYPARPVQCQTWPFWPENVETPDDWDVRSIRLPGVGPRPRVYSG